VSTASDRFDDAQIVVAFRACLVLVLTSNIRTTALTVSRWVQSQPDGSQQEW
jgi:hypothetical protein